jgi:hypothetical protein
VSPPTPPSKWIDVSSPHDDVSIAERGTAVQNAAKLAGRFVLRPSPIAGLGVFTSEDVAAKEILLEYQGTPFNHIVATLDTEVMD